ncbi:hypothetical protein WJX74_000677 [Apatococcus lobatus]|uniref:Transcription initiation factor TFIID subunit 13 n=1 Tax=Apatococcus lobatus TaxID=904363 RepID=A0AAW1QLY1_9CHLO
MAKSEGGRGRGKGGPGKAGRGRGSGPGNKAGEGPGRKKKAAAGAAAEADKNPLKTTRGLFASDLCPMMYGHGDVEHPLQETVDVVEDVLVEYVVELARKAAGDKPTITAQDMMWVLRKDRTKLDRGKELLAKKKEIDMARKLMADNPAEGMNEDACDSSPSKNRASPRRHQQLIIEVKFSTSAANSYASLNKARLVVSYGKKPRNVELFAEDRTLLGLCVEKQLAAFKGGNWYIEWIDRFDHRLNQTCIILPFQWSFPASVASDVPEVATLRLFAQRAKAIK